jgi:hypothetical protein
LYTCTFLVPLIVEEIVVVKVRLTCSVLEARGGGLHVLLVVHISIIKKPRFGGAFHLVFQTIYLKIIPKPSPFLSKEKVVKTGII